MQFLVYKTRLVAEQTAAAFELATDAGAAAADAGAAGAAHEAISRCCADAWMYRCNV